MNSSRCSMRNIKRQLHLMPATKTKSKAPQLEKGGVGADEGVPLAVAKRVFVQDPKPIIEELNEVLVA